MASPEGLVAGAWFEWRITGCSCKMFTSFNHLRVWSADLSNIIYHCYVKVVGHKCWVGNVKIQDLKWSECTLLNVYSILVDFSETRRIVKHPQSKTFKMLLSKRMATMKIYLHQSLRFTAVDSGRWTHSQGWSKVDWVRLSLGNHYSQKDLLNFPTFGFIAP